MVASSIVVLGLFALSKAVVADVAHATHAPKATVVVPVAERPRAVSPLAPRDPVVLGHFLTHLPEREERASGGNDACGACVRLPDKKIVHTVTEGFRLRLGETTSLSVRPGYPVTSFRLTFL